MLDLQFLLVVHDLIPNKNHTCEKNRTCLKLETLTMIKYAHKFLLTYRSGIVMTSSTIVPGSGFSALFTPVFGLVRTLKNLVEVLLQTTSTVNFGCCNPAYNSFKPSC